MMIKSEAHLRIRQELRQLGLIRKLPYKADEDTESGKYASQGTKRISKYYIWRYS